MSAWKIHCTEVAERISSESWNKQSLQKLLRKLKTSVQLTGFRGEWETMNCMYCGECDLGDLVISQDCAPQEHQSSSEISRDNGISLCRQVVASSSYYLFRATYLNVKSAQRDANTARQKFSPCRRPPSRGAQDRQNLISLRWSLPAPTDPVWWRSMHALSSYRGNRQRPPATNTHTQTGPITIHCAAS